MTLKSLVFLFLLVSCIHKTYLFENSQSTKEEVIQKAFQYISVNDKNSLKNLLLTREEHNTYFWKHVGERFQNDPGMSANDAYNFMSMETELASRELHTLFYGKNISISEIYCPRKESYGPYTLHLGCFFKYKDASNQVMISKQIRTVIELNNRFKLYHLKRD